MSRECTPPLCLCPPPQPKLPSWVCSSMRNVALTNTVQLVCSIRPQYQPLLSFKAGKMEVSDKGGDKFHITPDLRKGTISIFKGPEDQLMHFSWKERPSGTVVDVSILSRCAGTRSKAARRDGEKNRQLGKFFIPCRFSRQPLFKLDSKRGWQRQLLTAQLLAEYSKVSILSRRYTNALRVHSLLLNATR